ncbi:hypothetical protein BWQ96_03209 [Gracilariopsis chorda]|uniref:Uncharacterized protein n=1 Tax=Gracilariopsis chorda TaxID=448386 RepID=A0A2V3IY32_9FLOR|nr:hypothetical protein BWQ96_03209 [Gracilariopsis chorda]|eukprot:PXF47019.1 hypothetical protein BWQ96_03209 [Gracilariopsis chorda]
MLYVHTKFLQHFEDLGSIVGDRVIGPRCLPRHVRVAGNEVRLKRVKGGEEL